MPSRTILAMPFRTAALVIILLVGMVALGTSLVTEDATTQSPAAVASSMCHAEYGKLLWNSAPETAQTVRSLYISPGGPPPPLSYRKAKARRFDALSLQRTQLMAWCWTRPRADRFTAFALAAGHKPLFIEGTSGSRPPRPGPQAIL